MLPPGTGDARPLTRCPVAVPFALFSAARWPATPRGDWSGRCVDGDDVDELLVHELLNTEAGELVPVARHFGPAERQVCPGPGRVIDENHAGVDAFGDLDAVRDVLREHRSAEPVVGVVASRTASSSLSTPKNSATGPKNS